MGTALCGLSKQADIQLPLAKLADALQEANRKMLCEELSQFRVARRAGQFPGREQGPQKASLDIQRSKTDQETMLHVAARGKCIPKKMQKQWASKKEYRRQRQVWGGKDFKASYSGFCMYFDSTTLTKDPKRNERRGALVHTSVVYRLFDEQDYPVSRCNSLQRQV